MSTGYEHQGQNGLGPGGRRMGGVGGGMIISNQPFGLP